MNEPPCGCGCHREYPLKGFCAGCCFLTRMTGEREMLRMFPPQEKLPVAAPTLATHGYRAHTRRKKE